MVHDKLIIQGAREHNLKDVNLELPRDSMIVFTGLSGSGKSSLAFDTIFAEGQRRYVESLSSYARQFLGQMDKPDVDFIEGLSPAVSIDQKSTSRNPRSTVGTITEIHDYLRLLYARAGVAHCPECGARIQAQTPQQIVDRVRTMDEGTRFQVLSPVVRGRKGEYQDLIDELRAEGYTIASHSYGHLTYGDISPERLASDAQKWNDQIAAVIGETDVLLYPFGSDISGVEAYKGAKFDTLYGLGFRYFCNVDSAEHWVQIHDGYVRQGRRNIDGYRMYYQSNLLDDLFDTKTVWDDARPTPVPKICPAAPQTPAQTRQNPLTKRSGDFVWDGKNKGGNLSTNQSLRSSPQKNRATVPGPVWLPMVVPTL